MSPIPSVDYSVSQSDVFDMATLSFEFDIIAQFEGLENSQENARNYVGHCALSSETYGNTNNANTSKKSLS